MLNLTDQDFDKIIQKAEKPVLVDFWMDFCSPCHVLAPILEKISEDFKEEIIFAKVNLSTAPLTAQKYGIEQIPAVILFKEGKPVKGFIGVQPEDQIREWLKGEEGGEMEKLIIEYRVYAEKNGFKLNPNEKIVKTIIKGLLENEKKHGFRYCPCRRITGNKEEDKGKICPCQFHIKEIEKDGHCFCRLFVK